MELFKFSALRLIHMYSTTEITAVNITERELMLVVLSVTAVCCTETVLAALMKITSDVQKKGKNVKATEVGGFYMSFSISVNSSVPMF